MTLTIEEKKVPWIPIIILVIVLGFVGEIYALLLPGSVSQNNLGMFCSWSVFTPLPLILITLSLFINRASAGRISSLGKTSTLTYLYIVGVTSAFYMTGQMSGFPGQALLGGASTRVTSNLEWVYSSFMAPPSSVAQGILTGGVPVPWSEWMPVLLFWWIIEVLFAFLMMSVATILRSLWIDVEKLPFPHTMYNYDLVRRSAVDIGDSRGIWKRWGRQFIIGILLGLAFMVPLLLSRVFPWFPDIYGWRTNTCGPGSGQMTTDSPLSVIVGLGLWNKNPLLMAIFYFAPVKVLFNVWFWYLVMLILTQIAFYMGYYQGTTGVGGCGRVWCGPPIGVRLSPPFKWEAVGPIGGVIALLVMNITLNRQHFARTLKTAFGKTEGVSEFEKGQPISYRSAYLIFAFTFIALVAMWMISGISLLPAIFLILTTLIVFTGSAYVYGRVAYTSAAGTHFGVFLMKLNWPEPPATITKDWALSMQYSMTYASNGPQYGWGGPIFSSLSSYKMASLTGVSTKNVFTIWTVTSLIVPLMSMLGMLWASYTFGVNKLSASWPYVDLDWAASTSYNKQVPTGSPWVPSAIAGFILVVILYQLNARFVWFPLEPVGFLVTISAGGLLEGIWLAGLVAWIAKSLTLRIGGSKAYESYGVPIASGFVLGSAITILLGGILGIIRFFYPF